MDASELLKGLNSEQLEAVQTTEGYVRVLAGAGSGKTKALTTRYAYIAKYLDISTNRILSVTFTNKAANEMKTRILNLLGEVATPYIMTFHGFCNRFLRDEIGVLGFSTHFKILDTEDQNGILRVVYKELGITNKDVPYKKALSDIIGAGCKNGQRTYLDNYENILEKKSAYELDQSMQAATVLEQKIIYGYLREQKRDGCLDYEDLLNFALYILKTRKRVKEVWQDAFDYIQVDEFQDVSLREVELVGILAYNSGNLFVVGDDSQCIYSWRGADVNCIISFEEIMNEIQNKKNEVRSIYMVTNYRSTPEILDVTNSLIKANTNRVDKDLVAVKGHDARVLHYHARNVYQEAEWVANRILSFKRDYSDFAVLYRSNASSRTIEEKFIEHQIPYEVLSGISFYSRKEVKDVLSVLSLVAYEDNLSFLRVIKMMSLGIGQKKIDILQDLAGSATLYQALRVNADTKTFKNTKASQLISLVDSLLSYAQTETIAMLMTRVFDALKLEEMYTASGEIERWENLQELKNSANHFEVNTREKVELADYLGVLALYTNADADESDNKVKLMTIHGSKGLEYPIIFVIGMNEGLMPSARTSTLSMLEEERRIAYVAMTRAKDLLFLSDAEGENYDKSYRIPSRFLFNIDRDLYNSEGKMDEYLVNQTLNKMESDNRMLSSPTSSILDSIKNTSKIVVGCRVRHEIFGEGTVLRITPDAYVISFDTLGFKGITRDSDRLEGI